MPWLFIAPFIALAVIAAAMQAAVIFSSVVRTGDYRHFEDSNRDSIDRQFPLAVVDQSIAENRYKAMSSTVVRLHDISNKVQTAYHNAVVRSATCLALAFFSLALATLSMKNLVLGWVDFLALLVALILFFFARTKCKRWIADRSATELLRQYQFLELLLPRASSAASTDKLAPELEREANSIRIRVQKGGVSKVGLRVEECWLAWRASFLATEVKETDLVGDALLVYLHKRVVRQLGWFTDSLARLEHIAERRRLVLLCLYLLTFALGVTRHILLVVGWSPGHLFPVLQAIVLIATGLSAAMTAYYFNQNMRSLAHRYNTQKSSIIRWLQAFNNSWNLAALPSLHLDLAAKEAIRDKILQFEDLMIEELMDWIHITTHDAIELSP